MYSWSLRSNSNVLCKTVSQTLKQAPRRAPHFYFPERCLVLVAPRESFGTTVIYEAKFDPPDVHKHVDVHKGLPWNLNKIPGS